MLLSSLHVRRKEPHHPPQSHRSWPLLGQLLLREVSSFRYTHRGRNDGTFCQLWKVQDGAS